MRTFGDLKMYNFTHSIHPSSSLNIEKEFSSNMDSTTN